LSKGRGLLPPALSFCFDREGLNETERREIAKNSQDEVVFIPPRMYENYLLNSAAIAAVLNELDCEKSKEVTEQQVSSALAAKQTSDANWIIEVHAADLLRELFNDLSQCRVAYDKPRHGLKLTEWILQHSPSDLDELKEFLGGLLKAPARKA
jgi:hypothetical protein